MALKRCLNWLLGWNRQRKENGASFIARGRVQNTVCAVLPGVAFWCLMMTSASAADRLRTYRVLSAGNTRAVCHFIGKLCSTTTYFSCNKCIGDDTKAAARQSPNCIKNKKNMAKNHIIADGIITPCNVTRSWYWFRQVTAPSNVACGSGVMTVNSPSGSTLQCDTWLWNGMPLNLPDGSTLHCDT